jgi:hypothetical protein
MTIHAKGPPPGHGGDPLELSSLAADGSESAPEIAPAQEDLLLAAIKMLAADEIRAGTLENIPLTLAASGWRSTAALLRHAAGCADAGDFLNAERSRQRAREQFIAANHVFRRFMETGASDAAATAHAGYAELRDKEPS